MRLLQRDGYAATSWRGVVEEAGTPWGSAHHHFPGGKEQLAAAAVQLGSDLVVAALEDSLDRSETVGDAVRLWFAVSAKNLKQSRYRGGCPIATVALETAPGSTALTAVCGTGAGHNGRREPGGIAASRSRRGAHRAHCPRSRDRGQSHRH